MRCGESARRVALAAILTLGAAAGSRVFASSPVDRVDTRASATRPAVRLTPPTAAPDSSPSGARAPSGSFGPWRQVFLDDFVVDVPLGQFPGRVASRWAAYPTPWTDTSGNGMYAPERVVSVEGGVLRKNLRTEGGQPLVAALQPKLSGIGASGMLYGRYEVRARFDRLPGYKVAWLLWPSAGNDFWPAHGEINWPETDLDQRRVMGFVHHWDAKVGSDQSWARVDTDIGAWHTYTTEWSPGPTGRGLIVLFFDGVEVLRVTDRVPQAALRWVIQTETSKTTYPDARTEGMVEIDWVAAWTYSP